MTHTAAHHGGEEFGARVGAAVAEPGWRARVTCSGDVLDIGLSGRNQSQHGSGLSACFSVS